MRARPWTTALLLIHLMAGCGTTRGEPPVQPETAAEAEAGAETEAVTEAVAEATATAPPDGNDPPERAADSPEPAGSADEAAAPPPESNGDDSMPRHEATGFRFPSSHGEFRRTEDLKDYQGDGTNVSASYNLRSDGAFITATVYVYPGTTLDSNVPLTDELLSRVRRDAGEVFMKRLLAAALDGKANAGPVEWKFTEIDGGTRGKWQGWRTAFDHDLANSDPVVRVRTWICCFWFIGDHWIVKYRFTAGPARDVEPSLLEFMQEVPAPPAGR